MGTSQSSPGPVGRSPLVPSWGDDQPQQPLPPPEPRRFAHFRQSLGGFVRDRDSSKLKTALGHYASTASGGGRIITRRMSGAAQAGADLYNVLIGAQKPTTKEAVFALATLANQPCEVAINAIVQALTGDGGDADKNRVSMTNALCEALDGVDTFDPMKITDEIIINTMICFLTESIFSQIVMDAGKAWNKADTPQKVVNAENDLRELIKVVVDKHMAPRLSGNARSFSRQKMVQLEREVLVKVWEEWETYQ